MRRFVGLVRPLLWLLLGFIVATKVVEWITEAWFFHEQGYSEVFQKSMLARGALFGLGASWCALLLWFHLRHAKRVVSLHKITSAQRLIPLADKRAIDRYRGLWAGLLFVLIITLSGSYAATHWMVVWRAVTAKPTGQNDNIFGEDLGFYLFHLPALNFLWTFIFGTLWIALVTVTLFYAYEEIWQTRGRSTIFLPGTRHLAALGAVLLIWKALGYRLSAWNIITPRGEPIDGFGYTALQLRLPLLQFLAIAAVLAALALWRTTHTPTSDDTAVRAARRVLLVWAGANLILGTVVPHLFQAIYVAPRRAQLEKPLLEERRNATRMAFALNNVLPWDDKRDSSSFLQATSNIPLWTSEILQGYLQKHHRRGEEFIIGTPRFDRYQIDGAWRAVWVAPREAGFNGVGNGLIFCDATRLSPDGQPMVYETEQFPALSAAQPAILFGGPRNDLMPRNVSRTPGGLLDVLRPRMQQESSVPYKLLPAGSFNFGISLKHLAQRALLAWRFGDSQILQAKKQRLIWHRSVVERCHEIAPFFIYGDPHPVSVQGLILWIVPAHTVADSYPLAFAINGSKINYLRASAVAVVNAYDGKVQFFALDQSDYLLRSYRRLFPKLLQDFSRMPQEISAHLPLSSLQFTAQSDLWSRIISPSLDDLLQGKLTRPTALRQPMPWNNRQTISLPANSFLSSEGQTLCVQLFSQQEQPAEKSLSTPIVSALASTVVNGQSQLYSWRAKIALTLPEQVDTPITLNAALVENELLMRGLRFPKQQPPQMFWFSQKAKFQEAFSAVIAARYLPQKAETSIKADNEIDNKAGTPLAAGR